MKLADLVKKAMTGHSNTMYENIDNINGEFKVFEIKKGKKIYHFSSTFLNESIEKMNYYNKKGFPILRTKNKPNLKVKSKVCIIKPEPKINIKKIPKMHTIKRSMGFNSEKYKNRVDQIVYDPTMNYIPRKIKNKLL